MVLAVATTAVAAMALVATGAAAAVVGLVVTAAGVGSVALVLRPCMAIFHPTAVELRAAVEGVFFSSLMAVL